VLLVLAAAAAIALQSMSSVWVSDEPSAQQDRAEFERAFQDAAKAPVRDDAGAFGHDGGP
jgi:hypothetical protein